MAIVIEGIAEIIELGSWMPSTGPQWENPRVRFSVAGICYDWHASDESITRDLSVGQTLTIRGFLKSGEDRRIQRITRVKVTKPACPFEGEPETNKELK